MAASTCNVDVTSPVDLGALLDARKGAIVTLVSGETQLVAHRAVLAARSPVFEAMFRHDTRESSSGEVAIEDVPGPVLRQLLVYCYTLRAPQLPSMALQLLSASDKYGLLALRAECGRQLAQQLTVETAAATAVAAVRHSCVSLRQAAATFIKDNTSQVLVTQGWADALLDNPDLAVELTGMLAEQSAKASAPPATAAAASRPGGSQRQASAPPVKETNYRFWSLPAVEKAERLIKAARNGSEEEVRALLEVGADVRAVDDPENGWTALHWAAWKGNAAVVWLLVDAHADLNCRACAGGWTPLHVAAVYGRADAAAALLRLGADREALTNNGKTPRDLAREFNYQQVADLLTRR